MTDDYFIQEATAEHKGKYRRHVARAHKAGFTEKGTIKREVIEKDAKGIHGKTVQKEAVLARTLRRFD